MNLCLGEPRTTRPDTTKPLAGRSALDGAWSGRLLGQRQPIRQLRGALPVWARSLAVIWIAETTTRSRTGYTEGWPDAIRPSASRYMAVWALSLNKVRE